MSIIYSYPEQGALNANDLLIGTSAEKVGGKQKNITRNFSIQQIADFINRGAGFVDPVASDFQIPVFNQEGKKITGSIMSQDSSPSNGAAGSAITIAGSLVTTGDLTSPGVVTIGGGTNLITLNSETYLKGSLRDSANVLGADKQILLSDQFGYTTWTNYEAGLTYEGTWDALNNTTNGLSNSPALVSGVGVSGHFYIVNVEGTTSLGPGLNDWHVGDWAIFLDEGGQPASWQKIDNTSTLVGSGTAGTFAKWTNATTLNDSIMSESGTVVSVDGDLKVKDTIQATTGPSSSLKLKGNGTGGVEIMSADGITDGKITLNCSQNSHGVTLQSPPHGSGATYTLVLPTNFGGAGDVLTSAGANPSQLVWTTPTTGTVTGTGTENYVTKWSTGGTGIQNSTIFDNGTNVGIGTSSPDRTLSIKGNSATNIPLTVESGTGQSNCLIAMRDSNTTTPYKVAIGAATDDMIFRAGGSERMRIDSAGDIGIGTTSPSKKIHVSSGDQSTSRIRIQNTGTNGDSIDLVAGVNNVSQDGFSIFNATANQTLMTIQGSGNVGIGTTSPSTKLDVSGEDSVIASFRVTGGVSNNKRLEIGSGGDRTILKSFTDTTDAAAGIAFSNGNSEAMRIDSTGNVGIGTTSPSAKLSVNGNFSAYQASLEYGTRFTGGDTDFLLYNNPTDNSLYMRDITNANMLTSWNPTDFVVHQNLSVEGNVGIGTASPAVSLDISATDAVQMPVGITTDRPLTGVSNGMLRYNSTNNEFEGYINGNWGSIGGGAAGGLIFRGTFDASTGAIASGGSLYTCPAGGSGGTVDTAIGDLYIVTTAGSFFCSGTSLNVGDEVICITAATATNDNVNNWNAIASGAGGAVTGSGTTNYVPKFTGATVVGNSSIIDSSGKVGIGDIPSFKLDVNVTSSRARFKAASGDASIELSSIAGHDWLIQSKSDSSLAVYDEDEASERMRIDSSGNVGIGTTSPLQKLHVNSGAGNSSAIFESTDSTSQIWLKDSASSTTYQTGIGCFGDNLLFNNGGERMRIDSTGNVGIGGGTISSKLFVNTDNVGDSYFKGGSDNSRFLEFTTFATASPNAGHKINSTSINGEIALATGNTERMRISSSGNVGIGTSSPSPAFKTQLYDSGNTVLGVTAGTANYAALQFGSTADTTRGAIEYYTGDDSLRLKAGNNIEKVRVTSTGAISFGSTGTAYGTSGQVLTSNGNASPTWQAAGGGASTITTDNFSGNGTVGPFTLGATPSGGSTSFVDVFIDGVYQEISTYTVSGTALSFVVGSEPPTGTNIQTKTTSGTVSGALVSSVDIGQSSGNTGAVDLRIVPLEVTSGQTIPGNANSLYIFTATGAQSIATVNLPGSPTLGDSIKISNLGGLANVLGANGNKIMGVAADLTINTPTAAFEIIWSGSNNGWIIIGNV